MWQDVVDATQTLPREFNAIIEYEFDAARFAGMTTPTVLLVGGESPQRLTDATEAVDDALPNGRIVIIDGAKRFGMLTARDRFIDEVLAVIPESS